MPIAFLCQKAIGMSSDIEQILYPTILSSLRENVPPVQCMIWKGGDDYDMITFDEVYPFDTVDDIKRLICAYYKNDPTFLPRFTFVGIPLGDAAYETTVPSLETTYHPIDYLWYPDGTNDATMTYDLKHPLLALTRPDMRFVTSSGAYASPNRESRGRSLVEEVFLNKRDGQFPIFHVFTLNALMQAYRGMKPIGEEDWNKRFAPYFPDVKIEGPYQADADDMAMFEKIKYLVSNRLKSLRVVNRLLEEGVEIPRIQVTGIRQLLLTWKKHIKGFEGVASMFYQLRAEKWRPYLRLLPAEGSGITKLHVEGVLPIPSLDDPRVLEVWNRAISPSPDEDFCSIKYIHRPASGVTPPIYGTIHVHNDGTINLLLQPPKNIRKLDPVIDFRNFTSILQHVFVGLPHSYDSFQLKEIAVMFSVKVSLKAPKFNKARIQKRLPFFQPLLKEIKSIREDNPLISLRYKGVSQYATESNVHTFITQLITSKSLQGEAPDAAIVDAIQNEFQFSKKEAVNAYVEWRAKKGVFTLQVPEEDEFMESFNPGIDIHIYAQHPSYFVHANRVDSDDAYRRICTLLSLLLIEDDNYFQYNNDINHSLYESVEAAIEKDSIHREDPPIEEEDEPSTLPDWAQEDPFAEEENHTAAQASFQQGLKPNPDTASSMWLEEDPFADESDYMVVGEVTAATAPNPLAQAVEPKKTKPGVGVAAKPAEASSLVPVDAPKKPLDKSANDMEQKLIDPTQWFINKLKSIDKNLYGYETGDSKVLTYSRKCGGTDDRQPAILTKDQYERMREIYEDDNIFWIVYPLEGTEEPNQPLGTEETVTIMRYGSTGDSIYYLFCPHYFCLYDEIMVREVDFEATTDREGNAKPANTCPFCYGKLITNRKSAMRGYTVFKRKDKPNSVTYHKYIRFLDDSTHPGNLALPCCFVKPKTLRISNPEFSHIRDYLQEVNIKNESNEEEEEIDDEESLPLRAGEPVEYAVLFELIHKKYILESNKQPEAGAFAVAPPQFDTFFRQNSSESIITRVAIHLKLRPNANGFMRIGTEYSINESLLAVIAPLIYKNTINEVKSRILEVVTPRVFINSHFGNLVLEFYHPSNAEAMPPTRQALQEWAEKTSGLGIPVTSANMFALLRVYNAYWHFVQFIRDPTQRKDLRHIQPMLAEPGLFTTRGILLMVMEDNGANPVTIRCPTFGVSLNRHRNCDIAFVSRTIKINSATRKEYARYELYLHTSNKPAKGGEIDVHEAIIRWNRASEAYWPEIVRQRAEEYMNQCKSRYRTLYTAQEGINPMAMIPLSKAIDTFAARPEGILKDSYNHIISIAFRSKPGSSYLVALPVVDDGVVSISSAFSIKNIYLDWADIKPAGADEVIKYYKKNIETMFPLYPEYRVEFVVRNKDERKIVAVRLANGIFIPAAPPKRDIDLEEVMGEYKIKMVEMDQFEWAIDKQLAGIEDMRDDQDWSAITSDMTVEKRCGSDIRMARTSSYKEFEELYQQFRLMVSNWILSYKAGSEIRKTLESIIFNSNLPEYERRKRLYLFISSELLSWFYPDKNAWDQPQTSFLRKDCRMIDSPDACTGTCHWKQDEGKCLLHVKDVTDLSEKPGERLVSTPELFTKRIIDELVRFPVRRGQLMKRGEISKLSTIVQPIHQGDQYIIPESSITWANLLRLDWTKQVLEEPKYYEEMSRQVEEEPVQGGLPDILLPLFGDNSGFYVDVPKPSAEPFAPFAAILGVTMEQMGMESGTRDMRLKNMLQYVNATEQPIGLIDARNGLQIGFARPRTGTFNIVTVLVYWEDKIGVLFQEQGNTTVRIASMPSVLQQKWENAHIPPIVKEEAPVEESMQAVLAPGKNPVMAKPKRKPLVAQFPQVPLVEAPVVEKMPNMKKEKRKPRVGVPSVVTAAAKRKPTVGKLPQLDAPTLQPSVQAARAAQASAIPEAAIKRKPTVGVRT
jgi:hypothetical protein